MGEQAIKVAVGVMVLKEGKVLLAKRKASHGTGEYAFPGGHVEYGESFEQCARRELKEECDIEVGELRFLIVGNMKDYFPKQYVYVGMAAEWKAGEPKVMEPEKNEAWQWYSLDSLPSPLFEASKKTLDAHAGGANYSDCGVK